MKSRTDNYLKIKAILEKENSFAHILHPAPDGDSLGCAMAMHLYLKKKRKASSVLTPDPLPSFMQSLPYAQEVTVKVPEGEKYPVLFAYDSGDSRRIYKTYGPLLAKAKHIINIDHHVSNDSFGTTNLLDPEAAATGELVFELLKTLKAPIDSDMATWLYLSIMTDTGSFRYANTKAHTLRCAAELVELGASPHFLYRKVYEEIELSRLRFVQEVIKRMKREKNGKLVYAAIPFSLFKKYNQLHEDTQDVLDTMRSLKDVDVVVLFKDFGEKVKISFRSEKTDVEKIARQLGGGGHQRAAGADFSGSLEQAKRKVLSLLKKEM